MPNWRWQRGRVVEPQTLTIPGLGTGRYPSRAAAAPAAGLTIAEENALTGSPDSEWNITGAGDTSNLGFAREFSVTGGETVHFSCHGTGTDLDIYRIGWYGGLGWRLVDSVVNTATSQPNPATITDSNGATTCTAWSTTASWNVPDDATSGLYVGVYRNLAASDASYIPFIVRRDDRDADIMYKTSDSTWALAYNHYGTPASPLTGRSYYGSYPGGTTSFDTTATRVYAATYHRPIVTRHAHSVTYWLANEAPLIRWLERNGYEVTYTASKDWRETGAPNVADAQIYISSGHDEYWSIGMRDSWEALRDEQGKHLLFMSGNEVFWRTRFPDSSGDTQWCYKDTMAGPTGSGHTAGTTLDPVSWTGTWQDTRWGSSDPPNSLTGTFFRMNGINYRTMSMSSSDPITDHVFWRGTTAPTAGIAVSDVIGFEADELDPQQESDSTTILASTSITTTGIWANDDGEHYEGSTSPITWGVVSQRYVSGAVVVGFGSCGWSWGLDATHDTGTDRSNTAMRQATMNLLTDLGATAATPQSGLTVPSPVSLDNYGLIPAPIMPLPPIPAAI